MTTGKNCLQPAKSLKQERCIVYKIGAIAPDLPETKSVPVKTTYGIGSTGKSANAKKRKTKSNDVKKAKSKS